jgi:hypothetical protein
MQPYFDWINLWWSRMTVIAAPRNRQEADAEYRQRMIVNAVAASFIALLIISGYWVVSALAGAF